MLRIAGEHPRLAQKLRFVASQCSWPATICGELQPAFGRLALWFLERPQLATSPARQRLAKRFDMSLPDNQRKLEAVQQLARFADDAGPSMIELAILRHQPPRRDLGDHRPRTMEQLESQETAGDAVLAPEVPLPYRRDPRPGVTLNPADNSYGERVLAPELRRR